MENKKSFFRVLFTFVILAVMTGQRAFADNGWKVEATTSGTTTTFTISRTDKTVAETVKYRLVNLSAYAGQHYNVTMWNWGLSPFPLRLARIGTTGTVLPVR